MTAKRSSTGRKPAARKPATTAKRSAQTTRAKPPVSPGRPRKAQAPRNDRQADLAVALERVEAERDEAEAAAARASTVAADLRYLRADYAVASASAAYMRAQNNHAHALRYLEQLPKLAGKIAELRGIEAIDQLEALTKRARHEDSLGKGSRG